MALMSNDGTGKVISCGPLTILSNFDSGNFLKAELVESSSSPSVTGIKHQLTTLGAAALPIHQDYEVNIWTRPDCHGTSFENANRTWFYFGIKGGKPLGTVKINIVNLNKQTKLFLQGMAPVVRILPERPSWERVRDPIVLNENKSSENACSISFRQRLPENPKKSTLYIAFTFPYSCLELCEFLKLMDTKFKSLATPDPLQDRLPFTARSTRRDLKALKAVENDIYYHRECVCLSLEGRRVELITISSQAGISEKREVRLTNLFPITEEVRPFKFPSKKVVFLSARVHPGETPSSFVLNGFMKFIMDKADPRAVLLRKFFVFKIIPILNPDGVFKGHYRTDPRGVNLNRMYLNPSPVFHPSIYAARKLLIYYHSGKDVQDPPDEQEFPLENALPSTSQTFISLKKAGENAGVFAPKKDKVKSFGQIKALDSSISSCEEEEEEFPVKMEEETLPSTLIEKESNGSKTSNVEKKPYTFVLSDANSLCAGCVPFIDDSAAQGPLSCSSSAGCLIEPEPEQSLCDDSLNSSVANSGHQCAFEACDEDSVFYENLRVNDVINNNMEVDQPCADELIVSTASTSGKDEKQSSQSTSPRRRKKSSAKDRKKKAAPKKKLSITEITKEKKNSTGAVESKGLLAKQKSLPNEITEKETQTRTARMTRSRTSALLGYKTSERYYDKSSGLFLYIDMHGHTTKRGIFMYGNHFPDVNTQAECMLVPRLMAINSPHFDFAACNFTERLMCVKDRRDGASREGSGRVACLKLTGLIRSYTLECNYNTGRIVNQVLARPASYGFTDPGETTIYQPPKFTIDLFEAVGKSLAESILDMTGKNPYSRLGITEFKTLDGVKRTLISRLKLSPEYRPSISTDIQKKSSVPTLSAFDIGPLLSQVVGAKTIKNLKPKVPFLPSGPLGPRRENQNSPVVTSNAKASGSQQLKKLPNTLTEVASSSFSSDFAPSSSIAGTSTTHTLEKSSNLPKSSLAKVMKKKSFPRFASGIKNKASLKGKNTKGNNKKKEQTATSTTSI